jgi:pimeloyl-ACP methyl ester carboxylesterase
VAGATVPLFTRTWGDGPRRILLLHGISSSAAGWWRVAGDLAEGGWSVTAADLRGHGHSPSAEDYSFASHAADVLALGGGWDAVLGHSLGGAVAVVTAHRDPGWAAGLVLQDPALGMVENDRAVILGGLLASYRRPLTPSAVAEESPGWHPEDWRLKAEALRRCSPDVVRATFADNDPWLVLDEASSLPVPAVVLGSDPAAGGIVPVAIGEWLGGLPGATYRLIEGAGHSAHREVDRYDRYLEEVLGALASLTDRRA